MKISYQMQKPAGHAQAKMRGGCERVVRTKEADWLAVEMECWRATEPGGMSSAASRHRQSPAHPLALALAIFLSCKLCLLQWLRPDSSSASQLAPPALKFWCSHRSSCFLRPVRSTIAVECARISIYCKFLDPAQSTGSPMHSIAIAPPILHCPTLAPSETPNAPSRPPDIACTGNLSKSLAEQSARPPP